MRKCPICGREYIEYPAISRKDNLTEICPECGLMEALEDMMKEELEDMMKEELDKLEEYLIQHNFIYSLEDSRSRDSDGFTIERHQIIVYDDHRKRLWDVICQPGSYGYERGLLEFMESPGFEVRGYMTAEDVIKRIQGRSM